MRHCVFGLVIILCVALTPGPAYSAIYRWVDEKGVITFRDTPPPEGVKSQVVSTSASLPVGSEAKSTTGPAPVATQDASVKEHQVELFTTAWCPYCKKAVDFFKVNNIPFTEYDIEKDASAESRKNQLDGRPGVPFALIDGKSIHGFNPYAYKEALGLK